jgi:hypothetical protein
MMRDDYFVGMKVKAAVSLMVRRVAKEDTQCGARCKVVSGSGIEICITSATKNVKVIVRRQGTVKSKVWRHKP